VCFNSSISYFVFLMLWEFGRRVMSFILCVNNLESLYAGAWRQFTMGHIGWSVLCIFIRPLIVGLKGLG
jgi:hypothetical protein